jgi:hypothetical protein
MATPCSSRRAPTTGAIALIADAPQIIVPPASTSAIGRRIAIDVASACVTKNALGSATAATPAISSNVLAPKNPVCTFSPISTIPSRSTHLPVNRSPVA